MKPIIGQRTLRGLADESTDADRLRRFVEYARSPFPEKAAEKSAYRVFLNRLLPHDQNGEPLGEAELPALHREFGEMLRGLVAESPQPYPIPTAYGFVTRAKPGAPIEFKGHGRAPDRVRWAVVDLLLSVGENLLPCTKCGEPFVRERRQEYCSKRCSQRVRDRRRRGS
jgi:hypothetical protein